MHTKQWRLGWILVLLAVFAGALSMHVERIVGWQLFLLCLIAGAVGGFGYLWGRIQIVHLWNRIPASSKRIVIIATITLCLGGVLFRNHRKPDEEFNDALTCLFVLLLLLLWSLYRLISRFLDEAHNRFFRD